MGDIRDMWSLREFIEEDLLIDWKDDFLYDIPDAPSPKQFDWELFDKTLYPFEVPFEGVDLPCVENATDTSSPENSTGTSVDTANTLLIQEEEQEEAEEKVEEEAPPAATPAFVVGTKREQSSGSNTAEEWVKNVLAMREMREKKPVAPAYKTHPNGCTGFATYSADEVRVCSNTMRDCLALIRTCRQFWGRTDARVLVMEAETMQVLKEIREKIRNELFKLCAKVQLDE